MGGVENRHNIGKSIDSGKQTRFISSKERLDWNDAEIKVFQYKFEFPENPEGSARVAYRTLGFFSKIGADKLSRTLTQKGIKQEDMIAHITEFFPDGRWPKENINKNTGDGLDTEMINVITEEGKAISAKAIYIYTGKEKMRNFIIKHGFEPVDKKDPKNKRFFKILD